MFSWLMFANLLLYVEPDAKPAWHADWSAVQRFATKERKPILAVFA